MALRVDAMSVFAAVTATFAKTPAEKSLLCHVQFLRELLDRKALRTIVWTDARDMLADGLTKGVVDRTALHTVTDGHLQVRHTTKCWSSKMANQQDSGDTTYMCYFIRSHFAQPVRSHSTASLSQLLCCSDLAMAGPSNPKTPVKSESGSTGFPTATGSRSAEGGRWKPQLPTPVPAEPKECSNPR